ncbi:MAG: RNA 2',3'-cyclic phosphodiesterase [Alphaproteobacteria bacterium]|nr:RNA 2',3'-cyclic phosphodiesterase [Alphaproteobacteria bacterium]
MIRLFAALEVPENVRTQLSLLQGGIPGARWTPSENMHLTLRFIGEVNEAVARDIDDMLADIREPSFSLALKGVGQFGGKEGRALWAGVSNGDALQHLAAKIESALQRMGLPAETRKYSPHITLARLRDVPMGDIQNFLSTHAMFKSPTFEVTQFALFSSQQSAKGSRYRVESVYQLGA